MKAFVEFLKREFLLVIAGIAALVSCMLVPVTNYINYIDTDTIGLLFCLMIAVAGFRESSVLAVLSGKLLGGGKGKTRATGTILVFISFFSALFFTNDVALIAFVPITAALFANHKRSMTYVIILQTAAANLGSMLTPFGNPQNLYLYGHYEMSPKEFFGTTVPVFAFGGLLILLLCLFIKNEPMETESRRTVRLGKKSYILMYAILFILCLLAVFNVLDVIVVFASVCVVALIIDPNLFLGVDYGLLLTFGFFFIFVGNISNIPAVQDFTAHLVNGREMSAAVVVSQFISNVPAAVMLSGFTENAEALVLGTNIGGLGTIIASLASIISFRVYMETESAKPIQYLGAFTLINFGLLAVICAFAEKILPMLRFA
ncbi:MAG: citrate transporter [Oscillospiraceae bacterium]|nr:citrate transporter [Oscillospiraceae bacterium]